MVCFQTLLLSAVTCATTVRAGDVIRVLYIVGGGGGHFLYVQDFRMIIVFPGGVGGNGGDGNGGTRSDRGIGGVLPPHEWNSFEDVGSNDIDHFIEWCKQLYDQIDDENDRRIEDEFIDRLQRAIQWVGRKTRRLRQPRRQWRRWRQWRRRRHWR